MSLQAYVCHFNAFFTEALGNKLRELAVLFLLEPDGVFKQFLRSLNLKISHLTELLFRRVTIKNISEHSHVFIPDDFPL